MPRLTRTRIVVASFLFVALQIAVAEEKVVERPRAHAAPTGFNAIDVGGSPKDFLKLPGGYRDGFQKVIFEEVGPAQSPAIPDTPADKFEAYDDNSVISDNQEEPLFIPLPYRNETEAEKADRLRKEQEEKEAKRNRLRTSTLPPVPSSRNIVSNALGNRPPITIRPPPVPQTAPAARPFVPQRPPQQPPTAFRPPFQPQPAVQPRPSIPTPQQNTFQQPFVPQQRGFTPQPPRQPAVQPSQPPRQPAVQPPQAPQVQRPPIPAVQPRTFPQVAQTNAPRIPTQAPFIANRPFQPSFINRPAPPPPVQQPQIPPVQRPQPVPQTQRPIPQTFPTTTTQRTLPPQTLPPTTQQTFRPPSQPFRPLRPFRPPTNNFALPNPIQSSTAATAPPRVPMNQLRTGVCTQTIYYKPQEASAAEIARTFSHFAVVVSVDQCARTAHEFNSNEAIFDPINRHCQFNPTTVNSQSCESWPNPIYRNNVPITARTLSIKCVTCQLRRRNPLRPFQRQNARAFGLAQSILTGPLQHSTLAKRIHGVMIKENITSTTDVDRILRKSAEAEKIVETEALPTEKLEPLVNTDVVEGKIETTSAGASDSISNEPKNVQTTDVKISATKSDSSSPKSTELKTTSLQSDESKKSIEIQPIDSGTDEQQQGAFVVANQPKENGLRVHRLSDKRVEDEARSD
ncbi:hypothetical protein M3Y98_00737100 [Aphelenchoides besseyi]|nr:hypothetical protein M3Y98_00737100 [Aphelenchoides besseyi]